MHRHLIQIIGSSRDEVRSAETVLSVAQDIGDVRGQCWGNYDLASGLARAGEIRSAISRIEQARSFLDAEEMPVTVCIFLCTDGYVRLQASDNMTARRLLEESWRICKRSKSVMEYTVRGLPLLMESIAGADWIATDSIERKLLKRLDREAQVMHWFLPNLRPHILRARGRVAYVLGKKRKAIACFERAISSAASLGADYDRARSMLDLAAVKENGRDELCREAIELFKQQESVIPYAERWLLGDQFDQQCVALPPESL